VHNVRNSTQILIYRKQVIYPRSKEDRKFMYNATLRYISISGILLFHLFFLS